MKELELKLTLKADNNGVLRVMKSTSEEVGKVGQQAKKSSKDLDGLTKSSDKLNTAVNKVARSAGLLVAGFLGTAALSSVVKIADNVQQLEARVRNATKTTGDFVQVWERLQDLSLKNGAAFSETVTLFQSLARTRDDLKANNDQILQLTNTVQQLGAISGATQEQMSNALLQFSQAMAGGVVRAEEFNSIVENTPEIASRIAIGLGKTVGQLRLAVIDGKVLSKDVFHTLLTQSADIQTEFDKMPLSLGRVKASLDLAFSNFVDEANKSVDGVNSLTLGLQSVATAIKDMDGAFVGSALLTLATIVAQGGALVLGFLALKAVIPFVVAGFVTLKTTAAAGILAMAGGVSVTQLLTLSLKQSAVATWANITAFGILATAATAVFTAFAGWQIGTLLRKQFVEVRIAGLQFIGALLKGFAGLKLFVKVAWAGIKFVIESVFNSLINQFSDVLSIAARVASKIGATLIAGKLNDAVNAIKPVVSAQHNLLIAVAEARKEFDVQSASINVNINDLISYEVELDAVQKSTKKVDDSSNSFSKSIGKLTDELNDADAAFESQLDRLIEQNILLTLGERALFDFQNTQEGFTEAQRETALALFDTNKALVASQQAAEAYSQAQADLREQQERELQDNLDFLTDELTFTFDTLLFNGQSFTENLSDLFDDMISRMLDSALRFASNSIIQGLFSGNFGQVLLGAGVGALAIGASFLFGKEAPNRDDIAPSNTTVNGDSRALGFQELVATDIAARDRSFAIELAFFKQQQENLRESTKDLLTTGFTFKAELTTAFSDLTDFTTGLANRTFPKLAEAVDGISNVLDSGVSAISSSFGSIGASFNEFVGTTFFANQVASDIARANQFIPGAGDAFASEIGAGVGASKIASAIKGLSGAVGVITGVFDIFTSLSGDGSTLSKASGVVQGIGGIAIGASLLTGVFTDFIPVVGAAVAAISLGLDILDQGFTPANIGGLIGAAAGAAIGTVILPGVGTLIGFALGASFGKFIGGLFGSAPNPRVGLEVSDLESRRDRSGQNRKGDDLVLFDEFNANNPVGTVTDSETIGVRGNGFTGKSDFGFTSLFLQHQNADASLRDAFKSTVQLIVDVDQIIADGIREVDQRFNEDTLTAFADLESNNFISKQKLKRLDIAKLVQERTQFLADNLALTGTKAGQAFSAWFDLLAEKFGAENSIGLAAQIGDNLSDLIELPNELIALLDDSVKSVDLGGTPEDVLKEIVDVIGTFSKLKIAFVGLGADFEDEEIVGFLVHMNEIGFAVKEAGESLFEYSVAQVRLGNSVKEGVEHLFRYAEAQEFTNKELSNFISTVGSFSSAALSLGLSASFKDFEAISVLVGQIAKDTLDKAEHDSLKEQAEQFGGLTVSEARREIESLGLATGDAILTIVNELVFFERQLEFLDLSFSSASLSIREATFFAHEIVKLDGSIEESGQKWQRFFDIFLSDTEIAQTIFDQANKLADQGIANLGFNGLTQENFFDVVNDLKNVAGFFTPQLAVQWRDVGISIGDARDAAEQLASALESGAGSVFDSFSSDLSQLFSSVDLSIFQRYERELQFLKKIDDFVDSLFVNDRLSPLSNEQRLQVARSQFATQLSLANAGDVDALQSLPSFAQEYLTEARDFYASSPAYVAIFDQVTASLRTLSVLGGQAEQEQQLIAQSLVDQTQQLINESQLSTDLIIQALEDTFGQFPFLLNQLLAGLDLNGSLGVQAGSGLNSNPGNVISTQVDPETGQVYTIGLGAGFNTSPVDGFNSNSSATNSVAAASDEDIRNFIDSGASAFEIYNAAIQYGVSSAQIVANSAISQQQVNDFLSENNLPAFAKGGLYQGGLALVGEQGPELINFQAPGQVFNAPQTQQLLSGDGKQAEQIVDAIMQSIQANAEGQSELKQEVASSKQEIIRLRRKIEQMGASA